LSVIAALQKQKPLSPLYPEPLGAIFPGVAHQVCKFQAPKEISRDIRKAITQVRRELKAKLPPLSLTLSFILFAFWSLESHIKQL
jgi:hypothetical protein